MTMAIQEHLVVLDYLHSKTVFNLSGSKDHVHIFKQDLPAGWMIQKDESNEDVYVNSVNDEKVCFTIIFLFFSPEPKRT